MQYGWCTCTCPQPNPQLYVPYFLICILIHHMHMIHFSILCTRAAERLGGLWGTLSSTTISASKLPSFGSYLDRSITLIATSSPVGRCFPFLTIENPEFSGQTMSYIYSIWPLFCWWFRKKRKNVSNILWFANFLNFQDLGFIRLLEFHEEKKAVLR